MEENKDEFQTMNCDGCVCNNCDCACSNCPRCYRTEYAEQQWYDYYKKECSCKSVN